MEVSLDSSKLAIRNKNGENTFSPHNKYCVILNVQYRLFFTKLCGRGGTFHKNSFILETKLNVPKNFLLRVKREVQLA